MSLPTDGLGVLFYLALIVPGVIFISVRAQFRGFRDVDRSVGARILLAFVVSAVFDAVYVSLIGPLVAARMMTGNGLTAGDVGAAGWLFVLLAIVLPAITSWVVYGGGRLLRPLHEAASRFRAKITDSRYESTPTAWDLVTTTTDAGWVRVRLAEGVWVGGRFGDSSYFSTYPEPRDLYIQEQYVMSEDGEFGEPLHLSGGVWVAVRDDYLVEWVHDPADETETDVSE
ncbi:DUF6338 family protein [Microbacterium sp. WCS2018Hpa-23]|uniref:DUF6338 family protein n=1 Tax=Microbacterium sp. WCS2018Hpa-23 TaxID=3073634 RepID=UPI00288325A9|nr:DUF6338 family protein [Microbacterium sp. WCS2018Hpa-23]